MRSLFDTATSEVFQGRCRARTCSVCLPINARNIVRAVTMSRPENFIRLTMLSAHRSDVFEAMSKLRRWWRREVGPWQDVYAIEPNPEGTGLHLHGYQHGSPVNQGALEEAATIAGFAGATYGEPLWLPSGAPLSYFLKSAIYQPSLVMPASAERFLELNRYHVEKTRGFLRDRHGRPISTMAEAIRVAKGGPKREFGATTLE